MARLLNILLLSILLVMCGESGNKTSKPMESSRNAVVEAIMSRRSVRKYKPQQVSNEHLTTILECALNAPSAVNRQPWELRVVQDAELLAQMVGAYIDDGKASGNPVMVERVSAPGYSPIFHAPTFIVIACDTSNKWAANDCGMLTQNILLSAGSMGIGTCTIGSFVNFLKLPKCARFVEQLKFSPGYELHVGVAMGYIDEHPKAKLRDKSKVQYIR